MIFHESRLLADDPHVISYLNFCRKLGLNLCRKLGKMSQNFSSVAVVIGALRAKAFETE